MGEIRLSELKPLTEQEKQMIENAKTMPIVYDEDCPETTPEMLEQFRLAAEKKKQQRKRVVLSVRVSEETMTKAKALGNGYSGIISRMIEMCLNDPSLIKKCL